MTRPTPLTALAVFACAISAPVGVGVLSPTGEILSAANLSQTGFAAAVSVAAAAVIWGLFILAARAAAPAGDVASAGLHELYDWDGEEGT